MEENPYSAPQAPVRDAKGGELRLADRGMRLAAAIIDALIQGLCTAPMLFQSGYFRDLLSGQQPSYGQAVTWTVIGFVVFIVVQGYPLNANGQTWGKKLLKMKIVDLDGNKPTFSRLIAFRYLTTRLIGLVPVVGWIYWLVNVLFIFRDDRRCVHDLIAGTRVVMAD